MNEVLPFWNRRFVPYVVMLLATCPVVLFIALVALPAGRHAENSRSFGINYRTQRHNEFRCEYVMDYALNSTEANDVVFHGDSTCQFGVQAKLFEERTNLNAFNIATVNSVGWSGHSLVLERYLEHHPKPLMVVFCIHPCTMLDAPAGAYYSEERFVWAYGPGSEETRPKHLHPTSDYMKLGVLNCAGYLMQGMKNKSYRSREVGLLWLKGDDFAERMNARRGMTGLPALKGPSQEPPATVAGVALAADASRSLRKMAELCKREGTIFAIRFVPVWKEPNVFLNGTERLYEDLKAFETEFDNVVVLRPETLEYDLGLFYDAYHLNELGSTQFTNLVADQVTSLLERKKYQAAGRDAGREQE